MIADHCKACGNPAERTVKLPGDRYVRMCNGCTVRLLIYPAPRAKVAAARLARRF